jgi:hypothetical protein
MLQAAQQAHHQAQAAAVQAGNKRKREQDDGGSRRAQEMRERGSTTYLSERWSLTEAIRRQVLSFRLAFVPWYWRLVLSVMKMIGCDAPDCKIEWFHLNCIGLKEGCRRTHEDTCR